MKHKYQRQDLKDFKKHIRINGMLLVLKYLLTRQKMTNVIEKIDNLEYIIKLVFLFIKMTYEKIENKGTDL